MTLLKFLSLMVTQSVLAFSSAEESCLKLNTCVCMFSNKSIVDLWPVDGSSTKPSFTQIPEAEGRVFEWNPCTPFSTGVSGCNNVTSCQRTYTENYPAGTADTTFSVDSEGNVVITYGASKNPDNLWRQTEITLKCDPDKPGKGTIPSLTGTILPSAHALYTGTFTSKFACAFPTHQTLSGDTVQQKDEVII
ncbi:unnamed protein product [Porites lobata]|uniref:Uncharacterized protein n=1 Tax=Porites lobata TaxID=104759 RepID=A0ABN8Q0V7_9CNID|nr:unnamed protein product [Porites lobata]